MEIKKNNKREKNSFFTNYIQKNLKNDNNLKTFKFSLMFSLNYLILSNTVMMYKIMNIYY